MIVNKYSTHLRPCPVVYGIEYTNCISEEA